MNSFNVQSSPERVAEEGRIGFPVDFTPGAISLKPMNYPVGKPLEVSLTDLTIVILLVLNVSTYY